MHKYIVPIALVITACGPNHPAPVLQNGETTKSSIKAGQLHVQPELLESFTDSLNIGRKGRNKFELNRYTITDSNYVIIRFSAKQNNKWIIKNEFHFPKDGFADCDPQISDFNKDGLNDITYVSAVAARGANEIRTLLIYNKKTDALVYIKNSANFPNMLYNQELNCIDALLVSGCNTTVFLKLEADSLRQFAGVDQCDSLVVSVYDKTGNRKVISKKPTDRDNFSRFKNYRPLKEYTY
ncbi:hypothetical protein [Mucilaginibacter celer]|nr:hypothetical protein [Mucilaginibacter celer]